MLDPARNVALDRWGSKDGGGLRRVGTAFLRGRLGLRLHGVSLASSPSLPQPGGGGHSIPRSTPPSCRPHQWRLLNDLGLPQQGRLGHMGGSACARGSARAWREEYPTHALVPKRDRAACGLSPHA